MFHYRERFGAATWALIAIVALGLIVRIVWSMWLCPCEITPDGAEYARAAENLRNGFGYVGLRGGPLFVFPPFYSLLIALAMLVVNHGSTAGVVVSALAGTLFILPVFFSAKLVYGERSAVFAALIAAVLPIAVDLSTVVLSDALFLTLAAAGVYGALRIITYHHWRDGALTGLAFGLAFLTRPEGLAVGAAILLATGAAIGIDRPRRHGSLVPPATLFAVFAVVAMPYIVVLSADAQQFRFEGKSAVNSVIAMRMAEGMSYTEAADAIDNAGNVVGPELDTGYYFAGPAVHRPSPAQTAQLTVISSRRHVRDIPYVLLSRLYGTLILGFAVVGLVLGPWSRKRLSYELVFVLYAAAEFASLASVYHFWIRYADGFILLLALWGGRGIEFVRAAVSDRFNGEVPWRRYVSVPVVASVLACALLLFSYRTRETMRSEINGASSITEKTAGRWMLLHTSPDPLILSASDQSVYYAHGTWIMLPWAPSANAALRYVARTSPGYIVLDREQSFDRPYIPSWIDHGIPDARAHLLYQQRVSGAVNVAIYRWRG